jgi:hypothetical protein
MTDLLQLGIAFAAGLAVGLAALVIHEARRRARLALLIATTKQAIARAKWNQAMERARARRRA